MKKFFLSLALVSGIAVSAATLTINEPVDTSSNEVIFTIEVNPFCKLITKGDIEAVKSMIAAGTDINQKSVGMTPLMYAARYNRVEIVSLLIAKGADLKIKSNRGFTALEYAEMSKANETYNLISDALNSKKAS